METVKRLELIQRLVATWHLNVEERRAFAAAPLRRAEIESAVAAALARDGVYPEAARAGADGRTAYEGNYLVAAKDGWQLHWQRAHPLYPGHIVEATQRHFDDRDEAIRCYIEEVWKGQVDGIPIVD